MNIFYLSKKTSRCARWHCDKHVVKMILETAQLLYTAHWVLDVKPDFSSAPSRMSGEAGYMPIRNVNHPSAKWARSGLMQYTWLCNLGVALSAEFRHRFSGRGHSCEEHIFWLYAHPPATIPMIPWTQPPQAMPVELHRKDSVAAYRDYYRKNKGHLMTFTKRSRPHWLSRRETTRI
jgi:hypothetical protein